MIDQSSIVSQMIDALRVIEPDLDTSVGTTVRNILDVVAEQQAQGYLDSNIAQYAQAVDTLTGAALDQFVGMLGFTRFPAVRATGVVTLTQVTWANPDAVPNITIPAGSIFSTIGGVTFQTTATYSLAPTQSSIDIPVLAVVGGTTGNVSAGAITGMVTPLNGINSVTNAQATSGGADAESDLAFIARFKATIFRGFTGTEQCQPPGTMVLVPSGEIRRRGQRGRARSKFSYVPIETLREGDSVVAYAGGKGLSQHETVQKVGSRPYSGPLVTVSTRDDGRISRYTPNHRCIARLASAVEGKYLVYLMRKGTSFRIGMTTDRRVNLRGQNVNASGLADRLRGEGGDCIWVLSVHDNKPQALLAEQLVSWEYGIPTVIFKNPVEGWQQSLDTFWFKVGDLTDQAAKCLSQHGRLLDFPLLTAGQPHIWNRATEVYACNLLDGCEMVDVDSMLETRFENPSSVTSVKYVPVTVATEFYVGPVWSLDVSDRHTYVADGLATHNSFLGVALENPAVTQANVIGAVTTHQEQIQISSGFGQSVLDDIKYLYTDNQFLAQDLTTSTSDVVTGSLNLTTTVTSGVPISQVHVAAASGTVQIPPGTILAIGPDNVTVAGTATVTVDTVGEVLTVNTYTPTATTTAPATITFLYNTGQFYTPGVHFNLTTSALLVDPTLIPTVTEVTPTSGAGIASGTALSYKIAFANANGLTKTIGVTHTMSVTDAAQINFPTGQYPNSVLESLDIYIYGRTAGSEQLLAVIPAWNSTTGAATASWIDNNTIVAQGAYPTVNTTGLQVAVNVLNSSIPDGIYQVQYDYIPATSRNSYPSPLNCVDIYTNGSDVQSAAEALSVYIGPASTNGPITSSLASFNGTISSPFFLGNFMRADGTNPAEGNWFIPLSFGPLVSLPTTITSPTGGAPVTGPATYHYGTDYWLVNEIGPSGMSNEAMSGIEFRAGAPIGNGFNAGASGTPTNVGTPAILTIDYTFNAVPQEIYQNIQRWRLLSSDVMVHQAFPIYLNVYFVVVYSPGISASTINPSIFAALQQAIGQVSFNQILESSSLLAAAISVPGVANIRFARNTDTGLPGYGIQSVSPTGTVVNQFEQTDHSVADIEFTSNTYPVINAVITKAVAQNAFMQGGIVPLRPA